MSYCHQNYTVAWLCALPCEMAAAEAMLDERHPGLPTRSTDDNTYILGRIYEHNAVIACLRSGVYGTTSAATLARQMQSTFNSIRFFLMADIRLGDVVVSQPTREFGGVNKYDYGETMNGGVFRLTRPARTNCDPVIHYGLIASGNQVMKDARTRDRLSRELGILCFEMEAAGLMDDFQCLQWQEYAAATAAAYAKELLSVIHPVQLPPRTEHTADLMMRQNDAQDLGVLLAKISDYDHERVYQRLLHKRLVGTTQWFSHHSDFKAWFTEKTVSSLWCSGKIGSGKTMIATTVVEAAKYRNTKDYSCTVFFYCENERQTMLDDTYILASFIRQLCEFLHLTGRPCPEDVIRSIRKFFGPERTPPDLTDLKQIFIPLFHYVPETVFIIDGLDALDQKHSRSLLQFIQSLFGSRPPNGSRILLSSRDHVPGYMNIATFIPGIAQISTSTNVLQDIEVYIDTSIGDKSLYRKLTDNTALLAEVKQKLLAESFGMFLWVYLQLEIPWDTCHTDAEIRSALDSLPKGLEETYDRCMNRITLKETYALRVLKWVGFAIRPLHIEELRELVAFHLEDTEWNPEKIPQKDVLIGCCANLVVVDLTDNCVRFAHSSVKQYLDKNFVNRGQLSHNLEYPTAEEGDLECGELCVTYLSFSDFNLQLTKPSAGITTTLVPYPALVAQQALFRHKHKLTSRILSRLWSQNHEFPMSFRTIRTPSTPDRARYKFLSYAVANWALHTKAISNGSLAWEKFTMLATCFNETWNFHPWLPGGRSRHSLLHGLFGWAVKEQHEPLLSIALAARPSLQRICDLPLIGESLPALHTACKLGYSNIIEILLNFCKVNVPDGEGYTALHHAASGGHAEICELLLSAKGVNVDVRGASQCTPLWLAARKGPDIEVKAGSQQQTAVWQAIQNGHDAVVMLLLREITNPFKDATGSLLLLWASEHGLHAILNMLSFNAQDLDCVDDKHMTPLSWAVENGHEAAVVKLLLEMGADPESKDEFWWTPLSRAAANGHEAVVKLLLDRGADIESKDTDNQTRLYLAAEEGRARMELLLDRGVDQESKDCFNETPLSLAAANGHEAVVKLLIDTGFAYNVFYIHCNPFSR
ncbi:uncharacterized protein BDW70DRAFT_167857 [Aspergillus foveolatus]|uniref:uncharacterized protein n=1 Tax=Aspergillus foveolatus TaxID=210207 RepID=UPI003CCE3F0C